jgi:hypothetical protein
LGYLDEIGVEFDGGLVLLCEFGPELVHHDFVLFEVDLGLIAE